MGRVETLFAGIWGTVCDASWSTEDAKVLCRQLGLPYGNARAIGGSVFGRGSGIIWLAHVECMGVENSLNECSHLGWGDVPYYCIHDRDASVVCTDGEYPHKSRVSL